MTKGRLEAFSDGVIAIIITIMVLELKVPHGDRAADRCGRSSPVLLSYVLSFVYLGIYWNNHHHLLHAARQVNGRDPVGEPAPALLAVADPVRDRLDGREPLRGRAGRALRRRAADGRRRVLRSWCGRSSRATARTRCSRARSAATSRARSRSLLYVARDPARVRAAAGSRARSTSAVALVWLVPDRRIERALAAEGRE